MKYYKHRVTGRIINQYEYDHRISNWIKHFFVHMENADDKIPVKQPDKDLEALLK